MRLLLYLLRSPIWESYTQRCVGTDQQVDDGNDFLSRNVPLLGGLLASYLRDWIYYWRVYKAEEG